MSSVTAAPQPAELRALFLLRPDVVFLNHGSFGACPRPVFEQYQAWQLELQRQPVEFLAPERRFPELMREVREAMGTLMGADPDDLVCVPNATTGLNIVARSLALAEGDEILSTNHEYGALDRTWRFLCAKVGARYINHPLPWPLDDPQEVVESLWAQVSPRTKVLFLSHLTSPTGIILPVAPLIERARAQGILTIVDGAHVPGQIPLNLRELGADFYAGNLHKWVCSAPGSAFLYARREVQHLVEPLVISWGWEPEIPGPSRFIDEQEWQGTRDIAAYLSVPAAIAFQAAHQWPLVRQACHELVRYARARVSEVTGLPPLTPDSPDWFAQMVACPLPPCDGVALKTRLYTEFRVEVPITRFQERQFVRVSIQGYNSQSDVDTLIEALATLLPQVTS